MTGHAGRDGGELGFASEMVFHRLQVLHRERVAAAPTMHDLLNVYHQLTIMMIGLGLMLGLLSRRRAFQKLGRVLLMMVAVPVGLSVAAGLWASVPTAGRFGLAAIALILAVPAALFGTSFGREVLASVVGGVVYDGLRRPGCLVGFVLAAVLLAAALALLT